MASVVWTHGTGGAVNFEATGDSPAGSKWTETGTLTTDSDMDGGFWDLRLNEDFRNACGWRRSSQRAEMSA